jgi:Tol biopolymer transport system component
VDGRFLVYSDRDYVAVWDASTTRSRVLARCVRCDVSLSPDGSALALADARGLRVLDLVTGATVPIASGGRSPSWAPDGEQLAFLEGTHLVVVRLDEFGGTTQQMSWRLSAPMSVAWAPDGSSLAFVEDLRRGAQPELRHFRLSTLNIATSSSESLGEITRCVCPARVVGVAWSPSSNRLAVTGPTYFTIVTPIRGDSMLPFIGWGAPAWQPADHDIWNL